jgi:hypothetical protein
MIIFFLCYLIKKKDCEMSNGVVTQLGLSGKQDVLLSSKPEITFWKSQIRRHSVFASEPKIAEMQGSYGYDRRQICVVPRMGDLQSKLYLYVKLGSLDGGLGGARYVDDVGRALINEVSLEIGSVVYDKLYPEYMHAYEELSVMRERQMRKLTGKSSSIPELVAWAQQTQHLYIPLSFWIMDDWGQSLPIVSLHLSEVKINIKTNTRASLIVGNPDPYVVVAADATIHEMFIFTEVIFLSDSERQYMAKNELLYIIGQVQSLGAQTVAALAREARLDLNFNHPTKELLWMVRTDTNTTAKNWFNFVGQEPVGEFTGEAFKSATLKLNNNNRFENQLPVYFRMIQPAHHHSRIPDKMGIYAYSFSLMPESFQPSGSCNFSRLDSTRLYLTFTDPLPEAMTVFVFARSVNVISIGRGVSLLRYAS